MSRLELKCPPPLVAAVCALLIWLSRWLGIGSPLNTELAWLKYGLVFTALLLGFGALYQFYRRGTTFHPHTPEKTRVLVDSGLFRYSRNPMYLGILLLLAAYGLHEPSWLSPLWLVGFVLYMNRFQIHPEERALRSLFGAEYSRYMERTRRWI
ncbi:methyltransferase family protein [Marinobacterium lutimaris]|uniref:Protein-S-isoprenylcysteine O-methyltransferase Ste14 n=1 Tax=Marinobacterium lutimaris TaxID=568106 RepID=A0A1H5X163_9GAMM|nr:isoprenylcysteine carboxylmethyltransferase family protein [Marinobacterium lutimaris]SEG05511.1 Protein-S-isoprenylcysteine O-methyltransferase Ste14 [Marinobacterium lutimaris]